MRFLFLAFIVIHGLIHLLGFGKAFGLAAATPLKQPVSGAAGLLWLTAALLFLTTGALFVSGQAWWWAALAAVALSQALIILAWGDARFGTIANIVVLVVASGAALEQRPGSYRHRYQAMVRQGVQQPFEPTLVTAADLGHLPPLVQKYLRRAGVEGKPRVHDFRIVFTGVFRNGFHSPEVEFRSQQLNTIDPPSRSFLMQARMYGLPAEALHLFHHGRATMQIKLASLFQAVDARGPNMDQSETVTLFNDMCLFAPAALIDRERIRWAPDGPLSVKATFRGLEHTIEARLVFNEDGDLTDFISPNRFYSADGKTYHNYPWSTPVSAYTTVNGRRLPALADAVWHMPEGEFIYGRFHLAEIEYNIGSTGAVSLDAHEQFSGAGV